MKRYLGLAGMICALVLMAAPAMAAVSHPIFTITDDDVSGIQWTVSPTPASGTFTVGVSEQAETAGGQGFVDFDFHFNQAPGTLTFSDTTWNIFEQDGATMSDSLNVHLFAEDLSPGTYNTHGRVHFVSDSLDGTALPAFTPGGLTLIETGSPQTVSIPGNPITVTFTSDLNAGAPVPEPATLLLLGFGLVGVGAAGAKRKFKK